MSTNVDLLYPLSEFYAESGLPFPAVRRVDPEDVPEEYRRLLVHEHDMTPTLEAAYGQSIHLRVLRYALRGNIVSRQVLLVLEDEESAVELGAIRIDLDCFPQKARRLIVEQSVPLGTILRIHGISHRCRPKAYILVTADAPIAQAFGVEEGSLLYGRQNVLWNSSGHALAEVIEILPPWGHFPAGREHADRR